MHSRTNVIILAGLAVLLAALLVGQRLGFAWAGGPGYESPQSVMVKVLDGTASATTPSSLRLLHEGDAVRRGETIETGHGSYVELAFENGSRLGLDEDSDATIEQMNGAEIAVRMTHGRLVVEDAPLRRFTVRTNETESAILAGTFTVIDEQERAVAHVIPFKNVPVGIIVHRGNGFVVTTPQEVHEIAPYEVTAGSFRLVDAAPGFYRRFGLEALR